MHIHEPVHPLQEALHDLVYRLVDPPQAESAVHFAFMEIHILQNLSNFIEFDEAHIIVFQQFFNEFKER